MIDQEHAAAVRAAAEALNNAINAAREAKVFARVMTFEADHLADWHPTTKVAVSVVKAI